MATRAFLSRFLQRGPQPPPQAQPGQPPPAPQAPPQQQAVPQQAPAAAPQPQPAQPQQAPQPQQMPQQQAPAQPRRPPTAGQLRRERRALMKYREQRIRDLGGLLLEMYKRDDFNTDLYSAQGAEIVGIEKRISELDAMLASVTRMTRMEGNRCTCGAPLVQGAHFCANCGRAVGMAPVVACAHCGASLPAEAQFCAHCGRPAEPAGPAPVEQRPVEDEAARQPTIETPAASDSWEQ